MADQKQRLSTLLSSPVILRQGELLKLSGKGLLKIWKKRYFCLTQTSLDYFKSKGGKLRGSMALASITCVYLAANASGTKDKNAKPERFNLELASGRSLKLCASSPKAAQDWVIAISNSLFHLRARKDSLSRSRAETHIKLDHTVRRTPSKRNVLLEEAEVKGTDATKSILSPTGKKKRRDKRESSSVRFSATVVSSQWDWDEAWRTEQALKSHRNSLVLEKATSDTITLRDVLSNDSDVKRFHAFCYRQGGQARALWDLIVAVDEYEAEDNMQKPTAALNIYNTFLCPPDDDDSFIENPFFLSLDTNTERLPSLIDEAMGGFNSDDTPITKILKSCSSKATQMLEERFMTPFLNELARPQDSPALGPSISHTNSFGAIAEDDEDAPESLSRINSAGFDAHSNLRIAFLEVLEDVFQPSSTIADMNDEQNAAMVHCRQLLQDRGFISINDLQQRLDQKEENLNDAELCNAALTIVHYRDELIVNWLLQSLDDSLCHSKSSSALTKVVSALNQWPVTDYEGYTKLLLEALASQNEGLRDTVLRTLFVSLQKRNHKNEAVKCGCFNATSVTDERDFTCAMCAKTGRQFAQYTRSYCSGNQNSTVIKNSLITILCNPVYQLYTIPAPRDYVPTLGTSVVNGSAWRSIWASMLGSTLAIRCTILRDITAILLKRSATCKSIMVQQGWQSWIIPFLRLPPARRGTIIPSTISNPDNLPANDQVYLYTIHIVVTLLGNDITTSSVEGSFQSQLSDTLCTLQQHWKNASECLFLGRNIIRSLIAKLNKQTKYLPPLNHFCWSNILSLCQIIKMYILSTPSFGSSRRRRTQVRNRGVTTSIRFGDVISQGAHISAQGKMVDGVIVDDLKSFLQTVVAQFKPVGTTLASDEQYVYSALEDDLAYFSDCAAFFEMIQSRLQVLSTEQISNICRDFFCSRDNAHRRAVFQRLNALGVSMSPMTVVKEANLSRPSSLEPDELSHAASFSSATEPPSASDRLYDRTPSVSCAFNDAFVQRVRAVSAGQFEPEEDLLTVNESELKGEDEAEGKDEEERMEEAAAQIEETAQVMLNSEADLFSMVDWTCPQCRLVNNNTSKCMSCKFSLDNLNQGTTD